MDLGLSPVRYIARCADLLGFRHSPLPVKGIHVQWTTDKPDAKTANWNVTQLKVSLLAALYSPSLSS